MRAPAAAGVRLLPARVAVGAFVATAVAPLLLRPVETSAHAYACALAVVAGVAVWRPTPGTRARWVGLFSLASAAAAGGATWWASLRACSMRGHFLDRQLRELVIGLAVLAGASLVLEMRRPLGRATWPLVAGTAIAMAAPLAALAPVVLAIACGATERALARTRSASDVAPVWRRDLEIPSAALLVFAVAGAGAANAAAAFLALLVLGLAMARAVPLLAAPTYAALLFALLAQFGAVLAGERELGVVMAAGCADAFTGVALVGVAAFAPAHRRWRRTFAAASLAFIAGGILPVFVTAAAPFPFLVMAPAVVLGAIALERARKM